MREELEMLQREKEAEHFKTWEEQEDAPSPAAGQASVLGLPSPSSSWARPSSY